jgi:hypothetical protein
VSERTLTLLRDDLAARLNADEWFVDINVLTERKADILAAIEKSLGPMKTKGGKSGTCVIVMSPVATDEYPDAPAAYLHPQISFRILENPLINNSGVGTKKEALSTAKRVVMLMKHFSSAGVCTGLIPAKPTILPVADPVAPVAYEVSFRTADNDKDVVEKVGPVAISPDGGVAPQTVTLACPTGGAAIYFTRDGSFPWVGNSEAALYTAPFSVNSPATVRAGAFLAGAIASNVSSSKFS